MNTQTLEERLKAAGSFRKPEQISELDQIKSQIISLTKQLEALFDILKSSSEKLTLLETNQEKLVEYVCA